MPVSSREGKDWTTARIVAHTPATVLDIGVGAGIYLDLLRPRLPQTRFIGVEIFQPYVSRFNLAARYDELIVADVMKLDPLPAADVVILGDVLEHLAYADARKLWDRCRQAASAAVFLSLPIVDYPQGAVDGNTYEAHLHTWTHEAVMADLAGIVGGFSLPWPQQVGAYEAAGGRRPLSSPAPSGVGFARVED